jgi:oligopeptide/dipeptide ABC transporter ATP-binding protein
MTAPVQAASRGTSDEVMLSINELKTHYPIRSGILRRVTGAVFAVDGVSFDIHRGEILGLVGESGCGKTTLGRTILNLERATGGSVKLDGKEILGFAEVDNMSVRRRMQIVFQDPVGSLNPRMPVSDLIGEGLLAQRNAENGWGKRPVRDKRVGDYLEIVGLRRDYARRYPHEFSGGQRQRIGIARALALSPEFIFADEPVSALDVSIQSQVLNLLLDLRHQFDLTYLFVAHNLSVVRYISDRVGVMYLGKLVELAPVNELYQHPKHPYTIALLSAVPDPDPRVRKKRIVLKGDVPSPAAPPSGCRFHTRCWLRERLGNPENCETEIPLLRDVGAGQRVACHWTDEVPEDVVAQAVAREAEGLLRPVEEALHALTSGAAAAGRPAIDVSTVSASPLAPPPPEGPEHLGQVGGEPYLPDRRTALDHEETPGITADAPTVEQPAPERPPF